MARMPRPKRTRTRFTIELTDADLVRWHALAQKQGITFEQLVRESVELAIARGSSR